MHPEPQGTDEELVREALKHYKRHAYQNRYGGMGYDLKLARAALDAFERLIVPQQGTFLEGANDDRADHDER